MRQGDQYNAIIRTCKTAPLRFFVPCGTFLPRDAPGIMRTRSPKPGYVNSLSAACVGCMPRGERIKSSSWNVADTVEGILRMGVKLEQMRAGKTLHRLLDGAFAA
jgi:hypothetical protein